MPGIGLCRSKDDFAMASKYPTMKNYILYLLSMLLLGSTMLIGQSPSGGIDLQNMKGFGELFNISQREGDHRFGMQFRSSGVDGTPWLFDETHEARLVLNTGDTLAQIIPVNLNLEENHLVAIINEAEAGIIPIKALSRIVFVEKDLIYTCLPDTYVKNGRDATYRFYKILHEGSVQFLKSVRRKLLRSNKTGAYSATDGLNDKYVEDVDYYLCETGQRCERIKLKGKDVVKTLEAWELPTNRITKADQKVQSEAELIELIKKVTTANLEKPKK